MPIPGYVDYQRREYCKDIKCPVQLELESITVHVDDAGQHAVSAAVDAPATSAGCLGDLAIGNMYVRDFESTVRHQHLTARQTNRRRHVPYPAMSRM